jgi:hypothetical protein
VIPAHLKGRDFLRVNDWSPEELTLVLDHADRLKARQRERVPHRLLEGRSLGMIFQKPSTRTRVSFEVGIAQLGGTGLYLAAGDLQLGRGETIRDTAVVLSRYLDGIMTGVLRPRRVVLAAEPTLTLPHEGALAGRDRAVSLRNPKGSLGLPFGLLIAGAVALGGCSDATTALSARISTPSLSPCIAAAGIPTPWSASSTGARASRAPSKGARSPP